MKIERATEDFLGVPAKTAHQCRFLTPPPFYSAAYATASLPLSELVRFPSRPPRLTKSRAKARLLVNGAGDGNRTRLYSLGSCRSTDELRPQGAKTLSQYVTHTVGGKIAGGGIRFISEVLRRKRHTVPFLNRHRTVTRWLFFRLVFC